MMDESRDSQRISRGTGLREAVLKVGLDSIPVLLMDASATNFIIQVERHPGVYEGETVWLHAEDCWAEVDVVRVMTNADGIRMELQRVEAREDDEEDDEPRTSLFRLAWNAACDSRWRIVAMGVIAISVAWVELRHRKVTVESIRDMVPFLKPEQEDPDAWMKDSVRRSVEKMGAGVFLSQQVSGSLGLSGSQRHKMRLIVGRTNRTVEMATSGGSSEDYVERLKIESHRKAVALLTPSQQHRWDRWLEMAEQELRRRVRETAQKDP